MSNGSIVNNDSMLRKVTIGGVEVAMPKLVSAKAIAIKDVIASGIKDYFAIKSSGIVSDSELKASLETRQKISDMQAEIAFESDDQKKALLNKKLEDLNMEALMEKVAIQRAAMDKSGNDAFQFLKDRIMENSIDVISIAIGKFDDDGNLVPYNKKNLKINMTIEEGADCIECVLDDLLNTKKKFMSIGRKMSELMTVENTTV